MKKLIIDLSFNQFAAFLPILFACLLFIFYNTQLIRGLFAKNIYWFVIFVFVFFVRSNDFYMKSLNPDEEQWIICANSIIDSPTTWLNHFALFDFTRFFTILPLVITGVFSEFLSYDHARFINIILFLLFFYCQFKLLILSFNEKTAYFITSFIVLLFAISKNSDLVAYNSEISALLLLTSVLYRFFKEITVGANIYNAFLTGILAAFIPFAKEQALLLTGLTVVYISFHWIMNNDLRKFLQFILGGITGLTIIMLPLFVINGRDEIFWVLNNGFEYAKYGLNMKPKDGKNNILIFLSTVWLNKDLFLFSSLAVLSVVLMLASIFKGKIRLQSAHVYFTTLFLVALYTVYLPCNFFFHYTIFLFLPFSWLIGWFYHRYIAQAKFWFFVPFLLLFLFVSKVYDKNWRLFYPISEIMARDYIDETDPVYRLIKDNTKAGDRMIIWGWGNNYYLTSKLKRASSFFYPQFAMGVYSGKQHAVSIYREDLAEFQPEVIVELIGKKRFFFTDKTEHSIKNNAPDFYKDIQEHYIKLKEDSNYLFYRRLP